LPSTAGLIPSPIIRANDIPVAEAEIVRSQKPSPKGKPLCTKTLPVSNHRQGFIMYGLSDIGAGDLYHDIGQGEAGAGVNIVIVYIRGSSAVGLFGDEHLAGHEL